MRLELRATLEEVMRAVETLQEFARAQAVPEKAVFGLALALEECGTPVNCFPLAAPFRIGSATRGCAHT